MPNALSRFVFVPNDCNVLLPVLASKGARLHRKAAPLIAFQTKFVSFEAIFP
jgi:hypothetical protein